MLFTVSFLPQTQAAWRFDAPSFFVGVIAAFLLVGLIFLFRHPLRDGLRVMRARLVDLRERLTAGAERHYLDALADRLVELHLAESSAPFEDLYLPPRFDPPHPRPSLHAAAREPRPVSIAQALAATTQLAIVGASGSGRTSLLVYLARLFATRDARDTLHLDERRLPILFHLSEIDWSIEDQHEEPAAALIEAALVHAPKLVAANITSLINARLNTKGLLLLIDGWDEIPIDDRATAREWLAALIEKYPDHRIVMSASPPTSAPLEDMGFAALSLGALEPRDIETLAQRWASVAGGGTPDAVMLAESMRQPPGLPPRPIDATLSASVWHKRGSVPLNVLAAYDRWIDLTLADGGITNTLAARSALSHLAWTMLEEGRSSVAREEITALVLETLPGDKTVGSLAIALYDSPLFVPLGQGLGFAHRRIGAYLAAAYARDTGQTMAIASRFNDPLWDDVAFFFAGLGDAAPVVSTALSVPDDLFRTTLLRLGEWTSIAPYEAPWRGRVMTELARLMMAPDTPDPLREQIMRIAVATRDRGVTYLFKQMINKPETQFKRLGLRAFGLMRREADVPIAAGLIHDKRADVQIEALRTLGEIGGQAAVDALAEALLELDDEPRRVAAEALARCGRAGWDLIKEGATLSDDQGEDVVRVRRAAVFGLACIDQPWARDRLLTMQREDPQWAVRSSATDALRLIGLGDEESEEAALDVTPLDRDSLGWLVQWSAVKGQSIGRGQAAEQALQRALDDLEPNVRLAAVHTYAHLGDKANIPALVNKLKDENPQVRDAAYHALVEIARRRGEIVSL